MTIVCRAFVPARGRLDRSVSLEKPWMKRVQITLCVIILLMGLFNPFLQKLLDGWLF